MIDISDGLSSDLRHICRESNVEASVAAAMVPIHEDAIEMRREGHSPLEHALHDGEDYELLFTSPDLIPADRATRNHGAGIQNCPIRQCSQRDRGCRQNCPSRSIALSSCDTAIPPGR